MAIVWEGIPCSICHRAIDNLQEIVACSHFIVDESDPLWPYSDSAMHPECFANWEHREAFVARYNATMDDQEMLPDGSIRSQKHLLALKWVGMPCSICRRTMEDLQEIVAFSKFIDDKNDPLCPYSNSAMHLTCFVSWEHRERFMTQYREAMR